MDVFDVAERLMGPGGDRGAPRPGARRRSREPDAGRGRPAELGGTALDLGTGCGVQALLADDSYDRVVATDRNPRAAADARLAAALNRTVLDVRTGDLLEPVAGESFDLVVSNPPFVVGPQRRYAYRDSGLPGDEICRLEAWDRSFPA